MFTDLLTYSGIITKTKAMGARLITLKEYEEISNLSSVTDFINYLKAQPAYQDLFANYDERTLHRDKIEDIIMNSLYLDYASLYTFASIKQRKALEILFFRYEINILKICLRNVFTMENTFDLSVFEPFFNKHSELDIKSLSASRTLDEFIGCLRGAKYYELFLNLQKTTDASIYDFEVQLDIFYYIKIWKIRKHLSKTKEQKAFDDIIGKEIDLLNIMWIFRSKKYYDMDSSRVYSSVIPIHYKLNSGQLVSMIEAGSLEEFISVLETTYYRSPEVDKRDSRFSVERLFHEKRMALYHANMKKYPASMCAIHYFLFMKELEIDRLTTSLECIRYGLESQDALNHILK